MRGHFKQPVAGRGVVMAAGAAAAAVLWCCCTLLPFLSGEVGAEINLEDATEVIAGLVGEDDPARKAVWAPPPDARPLSSKEIAEIEKQERKIKMLSGASLGAMTGGGLMALMTPMLHLMGQNNEINENLTNLRRDIFTSGALPPPSSPDGTGPPAYSDERSPGSPASQAGPLQQKKPGFFKGMWRNLTDVNEKKLAARVTGALGGLLVLGAVGLLVGTMFASRKLRKKRQNLDARVANRRFGRFVEFPRGSTEHLGGPPARELAHDLMEPAENASFVDSVAAMEEGEEDDET